MSIDHPTRFRVVSDPLLGRFVEAAFADEDDGVAVDGIEEAAVDAEFVVLDDDAAAPPLALAGRLRALAARLRPTADPRRDALLTAVAEARAQNRVALDAAFAAWADSLPRREERGSVAPDCPSVASFDDR